MFDHYRRRLRHAAWTWLEDKFLSFLTPKRRKDRKMGRHDKRAARNEELRERTREDWMCDDSTCIENWEHISFLYKDSNPVYLCTKHFLILKDVWLTQ